FRWMAERRTNRCSSRRPVGDSGRVVAGASPWGKTVTARGPARLSRRPETPHSPRRQKQRPPQRKTRTSPWHPGEGFSAGSAAPSAGPPPWHDSPSARRTTAARHGLFSDRRERIDPGSPEVPAPPPPVAQPAGSLRPTPFQDLAPVL